MGRLRRHPWGRLRRASMPGGRPPVWIKRHTPPLPAGLAFYPPLLWTTPHTPAPGVIGVSSTSSVDHAPHPGPRRDGGALSTFRGRVHDTPHPRPRRPLLL